MALKTAGKTLTSAPVLTRKCIFDFLSQTYNRRTQLNAGATLIPASSDRFLSNCKEVDIILHCYQTFGDKNMCRFETYLNSGS